jgi:hypothetical protein
MTRAKLFIEKVVDGEETLYRPPKIAAPVEPSTIMRAERFVFDTRDVVLLRSLNKEEKFKALLHPPYDSLWIEFDASKVTIGEKDYDTCMSFAKSEEERQFVAATRNTPMSVPGMYVYFQRDPCLMVGFMRIAGRVWELGYLGASGEVVHSELNQAFGIPPGTHKVLLDGLLSEAIAALSMFHVMGDVIHKRSDDLPPKLAAARQRRNKPALRPYTYIHLNHAIKEGSATDATSGGKALHLVRGHFKVRKSGTFWWRPYFAGTLPEAKRAAYVVKGAH